MALLTWKERKVKIMSSFIETRRYYMAQELLRVEVCPCVNNIRRENPNAVISNIRHDA